MIVMHLLTLHFFLLGLVHKEEHFFCFVQDVGFTLPLTWHNQHHCALRPPNLSFQQIGGVHFAPTRGMNLNFLNLSQEAKNFERLM